MKALAITLAAGAALWAGSVPLQPRPSSRLQRATSRSGKTRAGVCRHRCWWRSDDLSPAGPLRLWTGLSSLSFYGYMPPGWLGYGPAWYADGYGAGPTAGGGERSSSRRNRKPPFRGDRLRSAQ